MPILTPELGPTPSFYTDSNTSSVNSLLTLGNTGINWNVWPPETATTSTSHSSGTPEQIILAGEGGNDSLSAQGSAGAGTPYSGSGRLYGQKRWPGQRTLVEGGGSKRGE